MAKSLKTAGKSAPIGVLARCAATLVLGALAVWPNGLCAQETAADLAARTEFFEREVRPVLVEHCQACHGAKKQESSLRLDSRAGLLAGGDGGAVVDLDHPDESRLLKAIQYVDADLQMPPKDVGKLPADKIAAIGRWLAKGAYWPAEAEGQKAATDPRSHWSFQPIARPALPTVRNSAWPTAPIDYFVLEKLEAAGMEPAEPADRHALIRRLSYDLIGLPPNEDEVTAYLADTNPDATSRLIDRLLDSPHYGERWGRHWLDVARYADTKGYVRLAEERKFHYAFTYRDYVVRAFNQDLPFDRFVVEQLAADQLPLGDDRHPLAALGFLTLGRRFTTNENDIIDDRIDVVSRGLLGLTVTCARCHDHKYDPIPTADYYGLYGVFASSEDPLVPALIEPVSPDAASQAFEAEYQKRWQALDDYEPKQYRSLLDELRTRSGDYLLQALAGRLSPQQPLPCDHGAIRQWVVERWIDYLDRTDGSHAMFGPWHTFAALPKDDFATGAAGVIASWSDTPSINRLVREHFTSQLPTSMADVARGYGKLLAQAHDHWRALEASHIAASSGAPERLADPAEEALRQVLYTPNSPVDMGRQVALFQYLHDGGINSEIMNRRNAINAHLANTAQAPARAHTLVETAAPPDPRILIRGNPTRPGRTVTRHFLSVLTKGEPRAFAPQSSRLELARAITSRDNPLLARVMVNRVWAHHFGAGLVRTPSNLGLRGQEPTHPELLDYLAGRFMDEGWSVKQLHRWILLSSTYQQASRDREEYRQRDPENRQLWKMNRRRLDFESLRDTLLVAAGRLDRSVAGPSVDLAAVGNNRRTLYGLVDRQGLPGMMPTFDFASPDTHTAERYTTTVPQQALFLLNSPLVIETARALAARADIQNIADPSQRAARMLSIAWGRTPSAEEIRRAVEFVEQDHQSAGAEATPSRGPLDAWAALAQTLLLSNELSYVD